MTANPDACPVAAFDIIRPLADQRFEDQIREACQMYRTSLTYGAEKRDRFASEEVIAQPKLDSMMIDILYVDKNNTPDKWESIAKLMHAIQEEE